MDALQQGGQEELVFAANRLALGGAEALPHLRIVVPRVRRVPVDRAIGWDRVTRFRPCITHVYPSHT